jgi:uroporphyrinogen decarboxylase
MKNNMTSRERVHAAAKGLPIDRVPVFYWLNPHLACRLMSEFQPARSPLVNCQGRFLWKKISRGGGMESAEIWRLLPHLLNDYCIGRYPLELGADVAITTIGSDAFLKRLYIENKHFRILDAWGTIRGIDHGIYLDIVQPAIKTADDLKTYRFPDFTDEKHYSAIRKLRAMYPDASIMVETFGVQDFFSTRIWDPTSFLMALHDYPDDVKDFQCRIADWWIDLTRRAIKAGADIVMIDDDYGFTDRPLISMKMWKEFTYPHLRRFIDAVHDSGALALLHSCGYQPPFLDYYVEAGLDILQSFQPKAGNDFAASYATYGDRLAFATGIDIQQGEQMSPLQLRESILASYGTGKTHGRHILGMTHMMQFTMPAENISAIFNTVREIQAGVHG